MGGFVKGSSDFRWWMEGVMVYTSHYNIYL
jgi:hypothetical protein